MTAKLLCSAAKSGIHLACNEEARPELCTPSIPECAATVSMIQAMATTRIIGIIITVVVVVIVLDYC